MNMGVLFYGGQQSAIDIDDRILSHLKIVITTKLRRGESFTLSWEHPDDQVGRRSTIWIHPAIPLRFLFDEAQPPEINQEWIFHLAHSANSTGGIRLVAEHFKVPSDASEGDDSKAALKGSDKQKD